MLFRPEVAAHELTGIITDTRGENVSFAKVECSKLNLAVFADQDGKYSIDLPLGKHQLTYSALGFFEENLEIRISSTKENVRNVTLKSNEKELSVVEVHANKKDIAKEVMRNASRKADEYRNKYDKITFQSYYRQSLILDCDDTTEYHKDSVPDPLPRIKIQSHLSEVSSTLSKSGSAFREEIEGTNEFTKQKPWEDNGFVVGMSLGEKDPAPQQWFYTNNYLIQSNTGFTEFDFNNQLLDLPSLSEKKYLSPLAPNAFLNYRFSFAGITYRENKKCYSIEVIPLFKVEPLFEGKLIIQDSTWAIVYCDFTVHPSALKFHNYFNIKQDYKEIQPGVFYPYQREITYSIKEGKNNYSGYMKAFYEHFDLPESFPIQRFSDEIRKFDTEAFDKDSTYWKSVRKLPFNDYESQYAHECDSLQRYYKSNAYFAEVDSAYNNLRFMDFILYGVGYRNRTKQYQVFINPLIAQINPLGIGGYRHRLGGSFNKDFDNDYTLETTGEIDYGFRNQDIRGRVGLGLTYVPLKFVRTFITAGDYYDMINTYASIGSIFSRSNYVRTQSFSIAQRMEIINGLFAELTLEYSDQKPISDLSLEQWSARVFGDLNNPLDFTRYIKSEIRLDVKYRIKQKYMIKRKRKMIFGTAYPELSMVYRKGIPGLFNSEVNYDFIEIGARHEKEIGRWGNLEWSALAGSFINKSNLRILEHRYFRGSDAFFFSDPLRSFQLLGPTLSTPNAFLRANYFHHLNGVFLNKIPLLNRLKITEAIGAAMLTIPDQNFFHTEIYFGLERIVRIRKELFRFGVYGATSDNTLNRARFEIKFGINFYNSFTKRWNF